MNKLGLMLLLVSSATLVAAQSPIATPAQNRQYTIAVCIDPADLRLQQSADDLNKQVVDVVEKSADNVRAVTIPFNRQHRQVVEQARKEQADYLLTIRITRESPSQPAPDLNSNARHNPEAYESIRDARASTRIITAVEPLNGNKVRLFDSQGVNGSNFASAAGSVTSTGTGTVDQVPPMVVSDAAAHAMTELKRRNGLSK